jgi:hypothetical protein
MLCLVAADHASAQSKGSLKLVGTQPIDVQLTRGEADFGISVRNDSNFRKATRLRIVLDKGGVIPVAKDVNLKVGEQQLAIALTAAPSPFRVPSHDVGHVSLHLSVNPAPTEAITGVLVVTARGANIAPLSAPITIANAQAAPAASRLEKARVAPADVTIVVRRVWPSFSHHGLVGRVFGEEDEQLSAHNVTLRAAGVALGTSSLERQFQEIDTSGDTGGRARVGVTTNAVSRDGTTAAITVDPESLERHGTYKATVALDPDLEKSPTFTITVLGGDHWIWPLFALLLGAAVAYWNVNTRERVRPQRVLQLALTRAQARNAENVKAATDQGLTRPYTLTERFPETWGCAGDGKAEALDLYCRVDAAKSQEELEALGVLVADLEARVNLWPSVCAKAEALAAAKVELEKKLPDAASMIAAVDALLTRADAAVPADEATTKAYMETLDDQVDAASEWLYADALLNEGLQRFKELGEVAPAEHDPARWRPDLVAAKGLDDLKRCSVVRGLCRDVHVLRILVIEHRPSGRELMLDRPRLRDEAAGPESEDLLQFTSIARTPPASSGPEVTRNLVNAIGATDHLLFAVALAIAAVAYLAGVYSNTYGSVLDYLLAFAAGAGTTFAANWKLLPWYGRLKQPKAASAGATT